MNLRSLSLALAALAVLSSNALAQDSTGFWTTPAIPGYGEVHLWPEATLRPDTGTIYKAVYEVTQGDTKSDEVNFGFEQAARALNSFASVGVPTSHLHLVLILHGPPTGLVLKDDVFRKKYGHPNPNLEIISLLKKAGVRILVCGNALAGSKFTPADVNPDIEVAVSALATLIILQDQGYAFIRI